jgi:hypothetical protein
MGTSGLLPTPRSGKTTDESEESWMKRHKKGDVATPPLALAIRMLGTPRATQANLSQALNHPAYGLTSSPEAFLVSPSPTQVSVKAETIPASCGPKCLESFAMFAHVGSWRRMFLDCLVRKGEWYSSKCLLTWKLKGTKFNRLLFQLAVSTLRTGEIGSGLLPTARVGGNGGASQNEIDTGNPKCRLETAIAMLPILATRDYKGGSQKSGRDTVDSLVETGATKGEVGTKTGLKLQPAFALWMMGYPEDWCDLRDGESTPSKPRGTQSSPRSRTKSSKRSKK